MAVEESDPWPSTKVDVATRPKQHVLTHQNMNISMVTTLLFGIGQISFLGFLTWRRHKRIRYLDDDNDEYDLQLLCQEMHHTKPFSRYSYTIYHINLHDHDGGRSGSGSGSGSCSSL